MEPDWEEFELLGDSNTRYNDAIEARDIIEAMEATEAAADAERLRIGDIEFSLGFSRAYFGLRDRWMALVLLILTIVVIVYLWEHA